jgi:nickel/cobalt transporter (NicO) family protein
MIRRTLALTLLAVLGALLLPAPAQAHPLGNFTTNQYAGLRIGAAGVDIDYVLDLAELPAYQTRQEIGADEDGYAARTCTAAASASTLTAGGKALAVKSRPAGLTFPPGAGGLTTLRLQCVLHADARIGATTTITYANTLFTDRIGWREITAVGDRYTLLESSVPAASTSARLTAYPSGTATPDVRAATLKVSPGGPAAAPPPFTPTDGTQARDVDRFTAWFTDLVGRPQLTLGVGIVAFLIAVILGGAHAVAPGHGKTIMAAYLVSSRGRIPQALTVAGTVAATHTLGVLALGILLATSLQLAPDAMYDWLRLLSGVLVALVGAQLLHRAIRATRRRAAHHHTHHHDHDHELVSAGHGGHHHHDHDHDHHPHPHPHPEPHPEPLTHSHGGSTHTHHLPDPDQDLSVKTLLAMGFAGGLSPSPSAVVVLLGAAALGRAWYGVLLVLAYGVGLAATLTGIGFALARWGDRLHRAASGRWSTLLTHRMPTATATIILAVGLGMITLATASLLRVS